jgi:hypothetical protein
MSINHISQELDGKTIGHVYENLNGELVFFLKDGSRIIIDKGTNDEWYVTEKFEKQGG